MDFRLTLVYNTHSFCSLGFILSHISRFINLSHFLGSLRIGYGALSLQRGQHDRIPDPKHREQPGVLHH